jgi:hypothetical protein
MRKLMILAFVGVMTSLLSGGCCCPTLSESPKMHSKRVQSNANKDLKLMVEDWDRFWMCDKPSLLTPNNM